MFQKYHRNPKEITTTAKSTESISSSKPLAPPKSRVAHLPRSLQEVVQECSPFQDSAIVVTESKPPFKIVHVNEAWETLCGYKRTECVGKTLQLIQGPETNQSGLTSLLNVIMNNGTENHQQEAGIVVTNYKKHGQKFRNHLRIGPMMQENEQQYYVGLLQELKS